MLNARFDDGNPVIRRPQRTSAREEHLPQEFVRGVPRRTSPIQFPFLVPVGIQLLPFIQRRRNVDCGTKSRQPLIKLNRPIPNKGTNTKKTQLKKKKILLILFFKKAHFRDPLLTESNGGYLDPQNVVPVQRSASSTTSIK